MDKIDKKVLKLVKKKTNLDLEAGDIAFQLGLDEDVVQASLDDLMSQGLVARDEHAKGTFLWHSVSQAGTFDEKVATLKNSDKKMKKFEKKILQLLNKTLDDDLDVADIAIRLRLDQDDVQMCLDYLLDENLVIKKERSNNLAVWYPI